RKQCRPCRPRLGAPANGREVPERADTEHRGDVKVATPEGSHQRQHAVARVNRLPCQSERTWTSVRFSQEVAHEVACSLDPPPRHPRLRCNEEVQIRKQPDHEAGDRKPDTGRPGTLSLANAAHGTEYADWRDEHAAQM